MPPESPESGLNPSKTEMILKAIPRKIESYQSFLATMSQKQWKRIGLKRRAGVATPLFSVYSKKSIGIGELPDLKLLADWCKAAGMGIIQLLPMNDTGFTFRPYDAVSGFALDPMYLSLLSLTDVSTRSFKDDIESLKRTFRIFGTRVNYKIKTAKLELLGRMFRKFGAKTARSFAGFIHRNEFWLRDYALFRVIKETQGHRDWESWPHELRQRDPLALDRFERDHREELRFQAWLQWQLFEQFKNVREYAREKGVLLMGDLPFLAARDSADVWSQRPYFKLDFSSGAPPDAYFALGQRWGTPPCDWDRMAEASYDYLIQKLKYAEHFYDLLRVDHVVGFFRLWSIPISEPLENGGLNGSFQPSSEDVWEEHGRKLLSSIARNTNMLVVGEDLGTVPECSFRVLEEFGICGMDVQRWMKDDEKDRGFKMPPEYRGNSIATLSTHDMASFLAWWEYEAGTVYEPLFKRKCGERGIEFEEVKLKLFDPKRSFHERLRWREEIHSVSILTQMLNRSEQEVEDLVHLYRYSYGEKARFWNYVGLTGDFDEHSSPKLVKAALEQVSQAASIFSVQLLQDWLSLGYLFKGDPWEFRINVPGTLGDHNWSLVMPVSLEEMKKLPVTREIRSVNAQANRV